MSFETSLEASVKIRQGKKWKNRYCVIRKLSSNENCAVLDQYENEKKRKSAKKKATVTLDGFFGTESGFTLDKETETLAVICHSSIIILSFDNQERLVQWDVWLRNVFGCGCQYRMMVVAAPESTSLLDRQNVRLHLQDGRFCLTTDTPPRIVAEFRLKDIRIYGPIQNKFCFEAGSRTGDYAGTYILLSSQTEQINVSFFYAAQNALHNHLSKKLCLPEAVEVTKTNFDTVGVIVKDSGIRVLPSDPRVNAGTPSISSSTSCDFRKRIYSNTDSVVSTESRPILDSLSESRPLLDSFTSSCSIGDRSGDRSLETFSNSVFEDDSGCAERFRKNSSSTSQQQRSSPSKGSLCSTSSSRNSPAESILEEESCPEDSPAAPPSNIDLDEVSLSGTIAGNQQNSLKCNRLVPTTRSIRSQKRLREELSRPVTGSYVCYDGEPESPLVVVTPFITHSPQFSSPVEPQSHHNHNTPILNGNHLGNDTIYENVCTASKSDYMTCSAPLSSSSTSGQRHGTSITVQRQNVQHAPPFNTSRIKSNRNWTPVSAPPTRIRRNESIFKFPPPKTILNSQSAQLNYCELETSNNFFRDVGSGGSEHLPYHALAPKSAFIFPCTPISPGSVKSGIEYAKIDEVATLAVMQNTNARAVARREKWSSIQTLSDESGKETKPSRRAFLLRPNLLRRRTSLSSLTSSTGGN